MSNRRLASVAALAFVTMSGAIAVSLGGCNSSPAPQPLAQSGPQGQAQPVQAPAPSGGAPQGRGTVPRGFSALTDPNGSGQLVFAQFPSSQRTASTTMREFLGYMQGYFDSPPQFLGAVGDQQDKVVQAMWHGTFRGQPVRGVATVALGSSDGIFAMLFDQPQLFAGSYARLAKQLGNMMPRSVQGGGGGGGADAVNWSRQTTGDRSAAATVPQGWRVTGCVNGALDIVGPNNQAIELGLAFPIFTSALPGYRGLMAPYMKPIQALALYESNNDYNTYRRSPPSTFGRIVETTPVQNPNGQGMYILQEVANNQGRRKVLAMVLTSQVAQNEWLLYISFVASSQDSFAHDLPIMMKIWGSWKVDDRVFQQRMQQALANMRETSNILSSISKSQSGVYDNINTAMDMVIRGHWPVENTETGSRVELEQNTATELERECQNQGIPCRQVPINQLTGGH